MRIRRIKIENFRAISSFHFDLNSNINVVYGENGVGKTTIVTAIAYLLSWLTARILNPKGVGRMLTDADIRKGTTYCLLEIELDDEKHTKWSLYRKLSTERDKSAQSDLKQLSEYADSWVSSHLNEEREIVEMPTMAVYDVNRSVIDIPQRLVRQENLGAISVYTSKSADFKTFFHWYREREDLDNERLRDFYNRGNYAESFEPDKQLQTVGRAITNILPEYTHLYVRRNPTCFVVEKNGAEFNLAQLSDGEKCYITLVGSIARRLTTTHPSSFNALDEQGVFIIDEIDLHLHPEWQRHVVGKLRKTFPNCQFIVTTHSPSVLGSVRTYEGEKIFGINNGSAVQATNRVFGSGVDNILLREFNVSSLLSPEAEQLIGKARSLLASGDYQSQEYISIKSEILRKMDPSTSAVIGILSEEAILKHRIHEED